MPEQEQITGAQIMSAVEGWRAWVAKRVPSAVIDDVLSEAAMRAWRRRSMYDAALGTPGQWVSTDVRYATLDAGREHRTHTDLDAVPEPATTGAPVDPLRVLLSRTDASEVLQHVAKHVGEHDWQLFLTLAFAEVPAEEVAERTGLTLRKLRSILEGVLHVGMTVRAAHRALERGEPPTIATAAGCIPVKSAANRELVMKLAHNPGMTRSQLATATGLSVKSVHNRVPELERLLRVASEVLIDHDPAPKGTPTWA